MFGEERKAKILEYVQQRNSASVQEISAKFDVSESTVRRDLQELEEAKLLRRTHGGAVSLQVVNFEPTFGEKEEKLPNEKMAIATKALAFIQDGDTILMDSGTTTLQLARQLKQASFFTKLTVVTNSLLIAQELQNAQGIDVIAVGGSLRRETLAFVGPIAEQSLNFIRVDKAFVATNAFDLEEGLTTPNLIEAATKRKMIEAAKQVILLADHSKFGKVAFAKVVGVSAVDTLICDSAVPVSVINELKRLELDVYVAET